MSERDNLLFEREVAEKYANNVADVYDELARRTTVLK